MKSNKTKSTGIPNKFFSGISADEIVKEPDGVYGHVAMVCDGIGVGAKVNPNPTVSPFHDKKNRTA